MTERWRVSSIEGGRFEISTTGRVREASTGRLRKLAVNKGYLLLRTAQTKFYRVHRLVAEAFIPNPEALPFVNHKNAVKGDNRVENLEWVTHKGNMQHAWSNGLMSTLPGSLNPASKLTELQVIEIRRRYASGGIRQSDLSDEFGVSQVAISLIIRREKWVHV